MTTRLHVTLFGARVGELAISGPLRSPEDWSFAYDAGYLASAAPVALSVSLPLRAAPHVGAVARNWFCNLLPEGAVRQAIAERLRIPADDDFELLAAIGGECAGAVSLQPPEPRPLPPDHGELDLDTALYLQGDDAGEAAWAMAGAPQRLSLAGAQDKLAVVVAADGRLRLPRAGEPSSHILKPDSRRFPGIRDAEALGLALARDIGLQAASARLLEVMGRPALLVERYDRSRAADGTPRRLHQEDFCQALGYAERLKYQDRGGPSLAMCSALLRRLALGPAAVQGLLDWVAFNALIGNADAHAKNLSLLIDADGRRRLAPFYDLVPTVYLPESQVERAPALRIGDASRIDRIRRQDLLAFAAAAGYRGAYVLQRVQALAEAILQRLPYTGAGIVAQGADPARVSRVMDAIATNAGRLADQAAGNGFRAIPAIDKTG
jgi:serine/threonine-protein kinase HipA